MMIKEGSVIIGAIIMTLLTSGIASATVDDEAFRTNQGNRPAINLEFDPDYSCLFDVFQLKCIPGSEQECPEGYGGGDTENCLPRHSGCPEGYHSTSGDETGQSYPDSKGCETNGMVLLELEREDS